MLFYIVNAEGSEYLKCSYKFQQKITRDIQKTLLLYLTNYTYGN